jgi:hypothetical protein
MRALRTFVIAALLATAGWTSAPATERVDLLLVLAVDVSGSVDEQKFQLQRLGYAAAFSDPRVIQAIRAGPSGRIAVAYIEFSGIVLQKLVIDWTVISNEDTARQFSNHILEAPRAFVKNSTSISAGIDFAVTQFDRAPYQAPRRTIDVSGDGDEVRSHQPSRRACELLPKQRHRRPRRLCHRRGEHQFVRERPDP